MCVLMGALAWGQAQPGATPPGAAPPAHPAQAPGNSAPKAPATLDTADSVPQDAVVLTIEGVCAPQTRPAAAKTAAAKTGTAPAKPAAKAAPAECKTKITRAEFEALESALSPRVTPQLKRQLETAYPPILAFAQAAHKQGLDKGKRFETLMAFYRAQVLSNELKRTITDDASKISDEDVDKYYHEHLAVYQQFNLDRVFVPHFQKPASEAKTAEKDDKDDKDDKDAKVNPEDQQEKKKAEQEQEEVKLAESLRTRAVGGEDFVKLQKDAYDAAGMKMDPPSINMPKVRRNALPPGQVSVFELKEGETSQVIGDTGGHYIYRVKAIEQMPLDDQLKNEIHGMLQGQRQRDGMDKYQKSFTVVPNEAYFGPSGPSGMPPGAPPMRNMPMPAPRKPPTSANPSAPSQTQPPAQPPAAPPN